tara:strand:- start:345 stop:560 length:216 start_codon:yes stop_codon:yes gene_type:complete
MKNKYKRCDYCGIAYLPKRRNVETRFCSDRCRVYYHRYPIDTSIGRKQPIEEKSVIVTHYKKDEGMSDEYY